MKHVHVTSETLKSDALALFNYLRLTKGQNAIKSAAYLSLRERFDLWNEGDYKTPTARAMETFRALDEDNWQEIYEVILYTR